MSPTERLAGRARGRTGDATSWTINAALAAKVGFATHQNAIAIIRELNVAAPADVGAQHLRLTLAADPPFVAAKTWRIDTMLPGDALRITDRDVALNGGPLRDLTESLIGTLQLTLTDEGGAVLAEVAQPVELLAHNQRGGIGVGCSATVRAQQTANERPYWS